MVTLISSCSLWLLTSEKLKKQLCYEVVVSFVKYTLPLTVMLCFCGFQEVSYLFFCLVKQELTAQLMRGEYSLWDPSDVVSIRWALPKVDSLFLQVPKKKKQNQNERHPNIWVQFSCVSSFLARVFIPLLCIFICCAISSLSCLRKWGLLSRDFAFL